MAAQAFHSATSGERRPCHPLSWPRVSGLVPDRVLLSMAALTIHHVVISLAVGGAETVVASLARHQKTIGHRVVVHALQGAGPLGTRLQAAGIPVFLNSLGSPLARFFRLLSLFRRHKPDVVHAHNIGAALLAAPAASLAGVPCIVVTRHGHARYPPGVERKFWTAARFCHRVVAVSRAAAHALALTAWAQPWKMTVVLNGADPAPVSDSFAPQSRPQDAFTLLSVGRLDPLKDFPTLLRAAALALPALPNLRVRILGEGPERRRLESLIAELGLHGLVELLGEQLAVGDELAKADLFVLASLSEGLPVALLEAFASGVPAVVTHTGGMPEVVQCCGAGVVVPPSQPESLARAIIELAHSPERLHSLAARARDCYLRHFTLQRMASDYSTLYLRILSGLH